MRILKGIFIASIVLLLLSTSQQVAAESEEFPDWSLALLPLSMVFYNPYNSIPYESSITAGFKIGHFSRFDGKLQFALSPKTTHELQKILERINFPVEETTIPTVIYPSISKHELMITPRLGNNFFNPPKAPHLALPYISISTISPPEKLWFIKEYYDIAPEKVKPQMDSFLEIVKDIVPKTIIGLGISFQSPPFPEKHPSITISSKLSINLASYPSGRWELLCGYNFSLSFVMLPLSPV